MLTRCPISICCAIAIYNIIFTFSFINEVFLNVDEDIDPMRAYYYWGKDTTMEELAVTVAINEIQDTDEEIAGVKTEEHVTHEHWFVLDDDDEKLFTPKNILEMKRVDELILQQKEYPRFCLTDKQGIDNDLSAKQIYPGCGEERDTDGTPKLGKDVPPGANRPWLTYDSSYCMIEVTQADLDLGCENMDQGTCESTEGCSWTYYRELGQTEDECQMTVLGDWGNNEEMHWPSRQGRLRQRKWDARGSRRNAMMKPLMKITSQTTDVSNSTKSIRAGPVTMTTWMWQRQAKDTRRRTTRRNLTSGFTKSGEKSIKTRVS
eukprot:TRINITY_DN2209_c0_g1_i1.p1 TRINITY_DN2209_c0_g1~~TRINITY_DN2209_c0_g1_i1.p1  ORF type:complete len:319 (-),score=50.22 TRINITY_DN2209_c0_g1_i1:162-1118(-)